MSLAGLWKLPVVFICENNQYAMGTPMSRTSPLQDLTLKAQGYGMPGDRFEGYDVKVVQDRVAQAVKRARRGEGPTFIEVETYRFRGHSMSDPAKYRSRAELEERKKKDPLVITRTQLVDAGVGDDVLDQLEEEVEALIEGCIKFADESEPAREETMWNTVYSTLEVER
jgi:pyruvate dehydrogenase E1 component alpha subunit